MGESVLLKPMLDTMKYCLLVDAGQLVLHSACGPRRCSKHRQVVNEVLGGHDGGSVSRLDSQSNRRMASNKAKVHPLVEGSASQRTLEIVWVPGSRELLQDRRCWSSIPSHCQVPPAFWSCNPVKRRTKQNTVSPRRSKPWGPAGLGNWLDSIHWWRALYRE